jgi:hypothetical protein
MNKEKKEEILLLLQIGKASAFVDTNTISWW